MKYFSKKLLIVSVLFSLLVSCGGGGGGGPAGGGDGTGAPGVATDKIFYLHFPSWSDSTNDMYMMYGDGSGAQRLTFTNGTAYKNFAGLSSDGYAVYYYNPPSTIYYRLFSVPLDNASESTNKQLESGSGGYSRPYAFTSDGRVIYGINEFYSDPALLYSVKADASEAPKTLSSSPARYYGLTDTELVIYGDSTGLYSVNPADPAQKIQISSEINWLIGKAAVTGNTVVYATSSGLYSADTGTTAAPDKLDSWLGLTNIKVINGYVFFNCWLSGPGDDLYKVNLDGTDKVTLTSGADNDFFEAMSPDNKVIYRSSGNLYSVSLAGVVSGSTTTLAASADNDAFKGVTSDNRVIVESGPLTNYYNTISSVRTDGTGLITLAAGTTGTDVGGTVKSVTPDGWVIYSKGNSSVSALSSVKADNSASGYFYDTYGGKYLSTSLTSNNKFVVQTYDQKVSAYKLYVTSPDGSDARWLHTGTAYTMEAAPSVVY